jgi:hypothetical protein
MPSTMSMSVSFSRSRHLPPRHLSRRETPRLEVEAVLNGRLAKGNLRLILHDLGFGGFAVESPLAFAVGSIHEFRFFTADAIVVSLRAEAVYSRSIGLRDGMDHFLSGFKYALGSDDAERAVEILLDVAMGPLRFD